MIKDIAFTICGESLCGEPCEGCAKDDGNCTHILTASCIYTAHIKPLEEALAKAEAYKDALLETLEGIKSDFERAKEQAQSVRDMVYLDGVLSIIENHTRSALARVKDKNND